MSRLSKVAFPTYAGKKSDIFERISSAQSLAEMKNACYHYATSLGRLGEKRAQQVCQAILDWHVEKISDHSVNSVAVIKNLNSCLECVGCSPLDETCSGPHKDEQAKLRDLLFVRTLDTVTACENGDMINMHLKDFMRALNGLSLRITPDQQETLSKAIDGRNYDWQQANLRAIGCSPNRAFA